MDIAEIDALIKNAEADIIRGDRQQGIDKFNKVFDALKKSEVDIVESANILANFVLLFFAKLGYIKAPTETELKALLAAFINIYRLGVLHERGIHQFENELKGPFKIEGFQE